MNIDKTKKSVIIFLLITFFLSSFCYYLIITGGELENLFIALLMWCPAVASFIIKGVFYRGEKLLGWHTCKLKYILAAIFIPAIYLSLSYGLYWLINRATFTGKLETNSIVILLLLIPSSIITATGEEIGWRGFLLPKLNEIFDFKVAILISGLIWAIWHFPIMVTGIYQANTVIWYQLPVFTIEIVAMTATFAYLRLKSKSIYPAILLHAFHNYFDQAFCMPLTSGKNYGYFVGETGIITCILVIIIGVFLTRKYLITQKNIKILK